jgi:hypothetical protein
VLAKLMGQVQMLTGYLLSVIAVTCQTVIPLICIYIILRGPATVIDFFTRIHHTAI